MRQRGKIYILEKELKGSKKSVNILIAIVCLLVLVNIIVVSRLMRSM